MLMKHTRSGRKCCNLQTKQNDVQQIFLIPQKKRYHVPNHTDQRPGEVVSNLISTEKEEYESEHLSFQR